MAQLVERSAVNRQVLGSIPREGVFFVIKMSILLANQLIKKKANALCGIRTHAFKEDYDLNVAP